MHHAASNGHFVVVKKLVRAGAKYLMDKVSKSNVMCEQVLEKGPLVMYAYLQMIATQELNIWQEAYEIIVIFITAIIHKEIKIIV